MRLQSRAGGVPGFPDTSHCIGGSRSPHRPPADSGINGFYQRKLRRRFFCLFRISVCHIGLGVSVNPRCEQVHNGEPRPAPPLANARNPPKQQKVAAATPYNHIASAIYRVTKSHIERRSRISNRAGGISIFYRYVPLRELDIFHCVKFDICSIAAFDMFAVANILNFQLFLLFFFCSVSAGSGSSRYSIVSSSISGMWSV